MYTKIELQPLPKRVSKLHGISERTISEHYKLYEGYVNKANETREKLSMIEPGKGNATYSDIRALKRGESYALNGAKLHELYFEQLGGTGKPSGELLKEIEEQYDGYEHFLTEFKEAGLSARGWAILAYDLQQKELFIYVTDDQHDGHVIQSLTILPMDVFEHAYYIDFGTNRAGYINVFLNNLDFAVVNHRYRNVSKQTKPRLRIFG